MALAHEHSVKIWRKLDHDVWQGSEDQPQLEPRCTRGLEILFGGPSSVQAIILSISIVSALSFSLPLSWIQKDIYALKVRVRIRDSLNLRRSQTESVRSAIRIELLQSRVGGHFAKHLCLKSFGFSRNESILKTENETFDRTDSERTELKASLTIHFSYWLLISLWWEVYVYNSDGFEGVKGIYYFKCFVNCLSRRSDRCKTGMDNVYVDRKRRCLYWKLKYTLQHKELSRNDQHNVNDTI